DASEYVVPLALVRWPGASAFSSATLSSASPALETTFALAVAEYVLATPGVNAPKLAAAPRLRLSVAGTVPPGPPVASPASVTFAPSQPPQQMPSGVPAIVPLNFRTSMPRL